jgi:RnfABCDGE-type electron transport complex B subunit
MGSRFRGNDIVGNFMKRAAVALIDEARCIGCTRCIDACPVDAIAGASGFMHTVVERWCIGCRLCLPPCPVDCIDMVPARGRWTEADAREAKLRAKKRNARLSSDKFVFTTDPEKRRRVIAEALAKRARR